MDIDVPQVKQALAAVQAAFSGGVVDVASCERAPDFARCLRAAWREKTIAKGVHGAFTFSLWRYPDGTWCLTVTSTDETRKNVLDDWKALSEVAHGVGVPKGSAIRDQAVNRFLWREGPAT